MTKKSDRQKSLEFIYLASYILQEYDIKAGMLAYDPEGLYQDIRDQAAKICADEINEIRMIADEARKAVGKELELTRLHAELQISDTLNTAYAQIIDLQSKFMAIMAAPLGNDQDLAERLKKIEADLPDNIVYDPAQDRTYEAFNIAVHDLMQSVWLKNAQTVGRFSNWAKNRFGAPDFDR